jgi:hypothetical protein
MPLLKADRPGWSAWALWERANKGKRNLITGHYRTNVLFCQANFRGRIDLAWPPPPNAVLFAFGGGPG